MPKNLGLYNNNLSVPRKQDVDDVQNELEQLTIDVDAHIGDTSNPHQVTKAQVGLDNVANVLQYSANNPPPYPVTSVNGKTGSVNLNASNVGARPDTWVPTLGNLGITATASELNKLDGATVTTQEINYLDGVTSNIQTQINNLSPNSLTILDTRNVNSLPSQVPGREFLVEFKYNSTVGITQFSGGYCVVCTITPWTNYSGGNTYQIAYGYTSTNVPLVLIRTATIGNTSWGPWYEFFTSANPPALTDLGVTATATELNVLDGITATTTELNYLDGVTSSIQTQLNSKVPTSRTVNNKALSSNITLSAADVSAVPTSRTVNGKPLSSNITLSASDVGALPTTGGTMTGALTLSGNPSANLQAATKQYVDTAIAGIDIPESTQKYSGTLPTSGWKTSGSQRYYQVSISGMTADKIIFAVPQWSNQTNQQDSWDNIVNIQSYAGYVRFYASAVPSVSINYTLVYY